MKPIIRSALLLIILLKFTSCHKKETSPAEAIIGRYQVIFTQPPKKIPTDVSVDAPMPENGYTGVAISGTPEKQVYYLARNDF